MSGQSANLSLKEAKAMQERIQAAGSQAKCGTGSSESHRKHEDHANAHNK